MKKNVSTDLTPKNIAVVLQILTETPTQLTQLSTKLPIGKLRAPLGEGERSFTETVAHLMNCEARTHEAICLALLVDAPRIFKIHPERD